MTELQLHPLCSLFPRLEGVEFEALKADIDANGQLQPIVIHDGQILDGGNRYRACVELGIEPITTEMDFGNYDLLSYVLSCNLLRRHLTPGQHAAIVAAATNWLEAEKHGGDRSSAHESTCLDTTAQRAAMSGASIATQRRADAVAKADPELVKQVARGDVTLAQAVQTVAPQLAPRRAEGPVTTKRQGGEEADSSRADADEDSSPEDFGPSPEEIRAMEEMERLDQEKYSQLVEIAHSDDKLAAALEKINEQAAEIKRQAAEILALRERQTGLMNEKIAFEQQTKTWMAIAKKLGWKPPRAN